MNSEQEQERYRIKIKPVMEYFSKTLRDTRLDRPTREQAGHHREAIQKALVRDRGGQVVAFTLLDMFQEGWKYDRKHRRLTRNGTEFLPLRLNLWRDFVEAYLTKEEDK